MLEWQRANINWQINANWLGLWTKVLRKACISKMGLPEEIAIRLEGFNITGQSLPVSLGVSWKCDEHTTWCVDLTQRDDPEDWIDATQMELDGSSCGCSGDEGNNTHVDVDRAMRKRQLIHHTTHSRTKNATHRIFEEFIDSVAKHTPVFLLVGHCGRRKNGDSKCKIPCMHLFLKFHVLWSTTKEQGCPAGPTTYPPWFLFRALFLLRTVMITVQFVELQTVWMQPTQPRLACHFVCVYSV
jgi:hypothetical protein